MEASSSDLYLDVLAALGRGPAPVAQAGAGTQVSRGRGAGARWTRQSISGAGRARFRSFDLVTLLSGSVCVVADWESVREPETRAATRLMVNLFITRLVRFVKLKQNIKKQPKQHMVTVCFIKAKIR